MRGAPSKAIARGVGKSIVVFGGAAGIPSGTPNAVAASTGTLTPEIARQLLERNPPIRENGVAHVSVNLDEAPRWG